MVPPDTLVLGQKAIGSKLFPKTKSEERLKKDHAKIIIVVETTNWSGVCQVFWLTQPKNFLTLTFHSSHAFSFTMKQQKQGDFSFVCSSRITAAQHVHPSPPSWQDSMWHDNTFNPQPVFWMDSLNLTITAALIQHQPWLTWQESCHC